MTCTPFKTVKGASGIICTGRGRKAKPRLCQVCYSHFATLECDGKKPKRQSGTCDKLLCERCATRGPPQVIPYGGDAMLDTTDFCPDCAKALERHAVQGELFTLKET